MVAISKMIATFSTVGFAAYHEGANFVDRSESTASFSAEDREFEAVSLDDSFTRFNETESMQLNCSGRRRDGSCIVTPVADFLDQWGEAYESPLEFSGRRRYNATNTTQDGVSVAWTGRRILDCSGDAANTLVCQGKALFWDAPHYALGTISNSTCAAKCPAPGCVDQLPEECRATADLAICSPLGFIQEQVNCDRLPLTSTRPIQCELATAIPVNEELEFSPLGFVQEPVNCDRLPHTSTTPVQCESKTFAPQVEDIWVSPLVDQDADCASFAAGESRPMKCAPVFPNATVPRDR